MAIQMSLLNALGGNFFKRGWDVKFFGRTLSACTPTSGGERRLQG